MSKVVRQLKTLAALLLDCNSHQVSDANGRLICAPDADRLAWVTCSQAFTVASFAAILQNSTKEPSQEMQLWQTYELSRWTPL